MLKTLWKAHKSKDHKILHRSYTQKKSQLRKKTLFFRLQKKCSKKKVTKIFGGNFENYFEKISKNFGEKSQKFQ